MLFTIFQKKIQFKIITNVIKKINDAVVQKKKTTNRRTNPIDCGKEFSNWKSISNKHDIDIYFADPGCPGQRGLNEHSNGLLRRDGLTKQMDFNEVSSDFIHSIASFRNHIPRKSLNYKTPLESFLYYCYNL